MPIVDTHQIKRLLIRSTNWIGDAVMTTPAIRSIRSQFPDAEISILAKPWVAPVFRHNPNIDTILLFDGNGKHKGVFGKVILAKELRRMKFDAAILLQNAIEAAIIVFFAGIPQRIGYNTDGRSFLLTHAVPCTPHIRSVHQTQYYLNILKGAGWKTGSDQLDVFVSREEDWNAGRMLEKAGFSVSKRIIGVNPGAAYGSAKRWFPDRFAAVCRRIGGQVIIFGTTEDEPLGEEIRQSIQFPCINLCGKTNLREAIALIQRCHLFLTNDSGLMHIAAALDIPLIAIFGSTDHTTTAPLGNKSRIVRYPTDCSPCLKTECPSDHRCMSSISVDSVYSTAESLMNSQAPTPSQGGFRTRPYF